MPTMSRAAVLAIPALVSYGAVLCHAAGRGSSRGSAPGQAVEGVNQHVDGRLGKACAHRPLKGRDIAARRRPCLARTAERPGLGEGVERFLLQLLGLELDR